jgi:hypothetical protein
VKVKKPGTETPKPICSLANLRRQKCSKESVRRTARRGAKTPPFLVENERPPNIIGRIDYPVVTNNNGFILP